MTGSSCRFTVVPTGQLQPGIVLRSHIYDPNGSGLKLLSAGVTITEDLLQGLSRRGVTQVVVDECDRIRLEALRPKGTAKVALPDRRGIVCPATSDLSRRLDALLERCPEMPPLAAQTAPPSPRGDRNVLLQPYDPAVINQMLDWHVQAVVEVNAFYAQLLAGEPLQFDRLLEACHTALNALREESDLFVCVGINPSTRGYPSRHALHVAQLAMAMGTTLGLAEPQLLELSLGCLLHDAGMSRIQREVFLSHEVLSTSAFVEVTKHPILTFDLLKEHAAVLPATARMVAYQMHERCDGSGYPRGRTLANIHPLARIAAVADAFVALVTPRPHRPGLIPYYAMELLIRSARQGLYDPAAVKALAQTVSLFPIGSYIATNDGRVGRVIRACPQRYDRPVVELWPEGRLNESPVLVDLQSAPEVSITRVLARLG
jgi:hypothetical protein